jgi:hypothetical protein
LLEPTGEQLATRTNLRGVARQQPQDHRLARQLINGRSLRQNQRRSKTSCKSTTLMWLTTTLS